MGLNDHRMIVFALAGWIANGCSPSSEQHADMGGANDLIVVSHGAPAISQYELRNAMRSLWIDHVTWTRFYVVSAIADLPDANVAAARLLQNQAAIGHAIKPFYGEAAGEATFLATANHYWPVTELKTMMHMHLDHTLAEATARLSADWMSDVAAYDVVVTHILEMSDVLSDGIAKQFPGTLN